MGNEAQKPLPRENRVSCTLVERRKDERCSFTAAVTILEPASGTRVEARTTDLCIGGCYVDTMNSFPVGTVVELRLTKDGRSFHSMAKVVSSQADVGMGLAFRSPESSQVLLLGKWLKELRGEASREPHSLDQDETAHNRLDGKDELRLAFEALVVHLMSKEVLSEDEGDAILRRLLN
jgi:hypothetical protein